jgi:hypothetical protein
MKRFTVDCIAYIADLLVDLSCGVYTLAILIDEEYANHLALEKYKELK